MFRVSSPRRWRWFRRRVARTIGGVGNVGSGVDLFVDGVVQFGDISYRGVEIKEFPSVPQDDVEIDVATVGRKSSSATIQVDSSLEDESILENLLAANDKLLVEEKEVDLRLMRVSVCVCVHACVRACLCVCVFTCI